MFADFAGESLPFVDVFLAETFGAMPEDLMKEHGGSASGEQRRTGVRINQRSFIESLGLRNHGLDSREDNFIVRSILRVEPIEIGVAIDVHSIRGFALDVELEAVMHLAKGELGTFGIHLVLIHSQRSESRDRIEDFGRFTEGGGVLANFFFPGLAIYFNFDVRSDGDVGLFAREIGSVTFGGLNLNLLAGFDFDQGFSGGPILAVGFAPDFATQHRNVIINDHTGSWAGPAGLAVGELVGVIELIGSDAGLDFEPARARLGAGEQRAVRARNLRILAVGNRAADEIGGRIAIRHGSHGTIQLLFHGDENRGSRCLRSSGNGQKTTSRDGNCDASE